MLRPSLLAGAVAAVVLSAGNLAAMPSGDNGQTPTSTGGTMLLAQGGGGGGGGGDSAGRGPDTSKGSVPKGEAYPSGEYPSGITSPGTAPTGSPGTPGASPKTDSGSATSPGTQGGGAPGTGTHLEPRSKAVRSGPTTDRLPTHIAKRLLSLPLRGQATRDLPIHRSQFMK